MTEKFLLAKISDYLSSYRIRHGVNKKEMGLLLGISPSSVTRLEEDSPTGLTLTTLSALARLEFDTLSGFVKHLEASDSSASLDVVNVEKDFFRCIRLIDKEKKERFLQQVSEGTGSKLVGNRFVWLVALAVRILQGNDKQLLEIETSALTYYLTNINKNDDSAKSRFASIMRDRFNL